MEMPTNEMYSTSWLSNYSNGIIESHSAYDETDTKGNKFKTNSRQPPNFLRIPSNDFGIEFMSTAYSVIFLLAIVGNLLVILTLAKNRSMRTVTNVLLLNLSIADLFVAVFCMPPTLALLIVQNYIFGVVGCKTIFYIQAVMISVSVFTLMAVSLERYFAICRPLHSRKWQTLSHAYKVIASIWVISAILMLPLVVVYRVVEIEQGVKRKCVEAWGRNRIATGLRIAFTISLDIILLLLPLGVMCVAYGKIVRTLYRQMHNEVRPQIAGMSSSTSNLPPCCFLQGIPSNREAEAIRRRRQFRLSGGFFNSMSSSISSQTTYFLRPASSTFVETSQSHSLPSSASNPTSISTSLKAISPPPTVNHHCMRVYNQRSLNNKRKIVCMLIIIVIEFFACWTPSFVIQTWEAVDREGARDSISPRQFSMVVLIGYLSTLCNPITYGFLNKRFRVAFVTMLSGLMPCLDRGRMGRLCFTSRRRINGITMRPPVTQSFNLHSLQGPGYSTLPADTRMGLQQYADYRISTTDVPSCTFN